jgi:hypothetical protein
MFYLRQQAMESSEAKSQKLEEDVVALTRKVDQLEGSLRKSWKLQFDRLYGEWEEIRTELCKLTYLRLGFDVFEKASQVASISHSMNIEMMPIFKNLENKSRTLMNWMYADTIDKKCYLRACEVALTSMHCHANPRWNIGFVNDWGEIMYRFTRGNNSIFPFLHDLKNHKETESIATELVLDINHFISNNPKTEDEFIKKDMEALNDFVVALSVVKFEYE